MILLLTGTPGSGKSAAAVDMGLEHVCNGGVVVSNFELTNDWFDKLARFHWSTWFSADRRRRRGSMLRDRWWSYRTLDDLWHIPDQFCCYLSSGMRKQFEGRYLLIIDEAQLIFNARSWQRNFPWIEFFSQHRKLGYDVILIAHDDQMIDSQVRSFIELRIQLRNMRHIFLPIPFLKISVSQLFFCRNLIHARWRYYGTALLGGEAFRNRLHRLSLWKLKLYDSLRLFREGDDAGAGSLRRFGDDPVVAHDRRVQALSGALAGLVSDLRCQTVTRARKTQ